MDFGSYLRFLLALVFVLALIGLLTLLLRRYAPMLAGTRRPRNGRRLSIREILPLDARNRLVLVRRDDVEHLLLLGPTDVSVVERGIAAPADGAEAQSHASLSREPSQ